MLSNRAGAVAAAVPPLRSIVLRALSTSTVAAEYAPSPRPRPSSARSSTSESSRSSRPARPAPSHNPSMPRFAAGVSSRSGGRSGSSSRLAPLERSRDGPSSYSLENIGQVGEEEEMDADDRGGAIDREERGEFIYHHKPRKFKPNTYPVPESTAPREAAQPARFEKFELNPALVRSLQDRYGEAAHTTHIQSLSLSHLCDPETEAKGLRVILGAETGSGKTLAYLLPLMHQLKATEEAARPQSPAEAKVMDNMLYPRAIVLSPTHELNRQSTAMAKSLTHGIKLRVAGLSNTKDGGIGAARGMVDCLFSTGAMLRRMFGIRKPGMDLEDGYVKTEWVGADKVEWLVIDEADVMLSRDFRQETLLMLKHISSRSPNLNVILTTATFPPDLLNLLKSHEDLIATPFTHLLSPALHKLPRNLEARFIPRSKGDLISDVCHEVRRVLAEDALKRMQMGLGGKVTDRSKVIVFCNSDSKVKRLSAELTMRDLPNLTWTKEGEERKVGSTGRLKAFLTDPKAADRADATAQSKDKDAEAISAPRILVTTGILSRGLDFSPTVSTVFLVDQPKDILDFIHRAGRAGRAGRKGRVVIFGSAQGRSAQDGKLGSMIRDASKDGRRTQDEQARYAALERERKKKIGKEDGWWGREAEETKRTKAKRREAEEAAAARAARRPLPRAEEDAVEERQPWWVTSRRKGKAKRG